jgi:hypothetical protein
LSPWRPLGILAGLVLAPCLLARAEDSELGCPADERRKPGTERVADCVVEVSAAGGACRATVTREGAGVFDETAPAFVLEPLSGNEVVLRTQGKERRFGYRIVGCEPGSATISFENEYPARLEPTSRGRRVLVIPDDGFLGFPDLPKGDILGEHAPEARVMVQEGKLVDVGREYRAHYDRTIRQLHGSLSGPTIRKFRAGKLENEDDRKSVAAKVVKIVGSYLESGRSEDAFRDLGRLWPESDVERVRQAILAAIEKGTAKRIAVPPAENGD